MKLCIINESNLSATEMLTFSLGAQDYLKSLSPWNFGQVDVSTANFTGDASKSPLFSDFDMKVYITNRRATKDIAGYHAVENGKPVSYVKPGTAYSRFGYYHPAIAERKRLGIITTKAKPEEMTLKCFGVAIHEIAEMLGNPLRNTFSDPDSLGREWYREITDHVHHNEFMKIINGQKMVFPDCALSNFYKVGATTDLSIKGNLTKSLTLTPKGYGSYKGVDGKLVALPKS